jgi:hypothetical protein
MAMNATWVMLHTGAILVALVSTACGGRRLDVGPDDGGAGDAPLPSDDGGASVDGDNGDDGGGGDGGAGLCPASVLNPPATADDAERAILGKWEICEGRASILGFAPADTAGIEFLSAAEGYGGCVPGSHACLGGQAYFLVRGQNGLVHGNGTAYGFYYMLFMDSGDGTRLSLGLQPDANSWATSISVSSNPREVWLDQLFDKNGPRMIAAP